MPHDPSSGEQSPSPRPLYWMSPPRETWRLKGRANFRSAQAEQTPERITQDALKARREWTSLANAILAAGGDVLVLPSSSKHDLTGLIYMAEAGLLTQPVHQVPHLLLPHMTPAHRQPEATWIAQVAVSHYKWMVSRHPAGHAWEAQGDVLYLDATTAIMTYGEGAYARTSREGLALHAGAIASESIFLKFKADPWFHGNTFLNVYHHASSPEERVLLLASEALFPGEEERLRSWLEAQDARSQTKTSLFPISVEESLAYATNSLQVHHTVIAPGGVSPRIKKLWREDLGLDVVEVALDQLFLKGGGAPVCLTCKLIGLSAQQVPEHFLWRSDSNIEDFEAML